MSSPVWKSIRSTATRSESRFALTQVDAEQRRFRFSDFQRGEEAAVVAGADDDALDHNVGGLVRRVVGAQ